MTNLHLPAGYLSRVRQHQSQNASVSCAIGYIRRIAQFDFFHFSCLCFYLRQINGINIPLVILPFFRHICIPEIRLQAFCLRKQIIQYPFRRMFIIVNNLAFHHLSAIICGQRILQNLCFFQGCIQEFSTPPDRLKTIQIF